MSFWKDIEIEYDAPRVTLIWGQWCNCSKIKDEIGWEFMTPLSEGIKKVYSDVKQRHSEENFDNL